MNYYGTLDLYLYQALDAQPDMTGKRVLLVGSVTPWYECICLSYGASCTTVDYNKLHFDHPGMTTYTVAEMARIHPPLVFDYVWTISSLEHDGLGRYGDEIRPDADLVAIRELLNYVHDNGRLVIAVPVGADELIFNSGRVYGPLRLPLLVRDWDVHQTFGIDGLDDPLVARNDTIGNFQPVLVLTKKQQDQVSRQRTEL
mmetsp:Transcript_38184/g.82725  ORF Transcript_38184/g.82725 Transcript_38184/m.82725 type:complete len:200 (+) Transcript_38184:38-637(+)